MAAAFEREIAKYKLVGLDAVCFIYHFEQNPRYLPLTRALFRAVERGNLKAVTSVITLTEILVRPLTRSREDLVMAYKIFLTSFPNLLLADIDAHIAESAAVLRAKYNLATPDALHIASAFNQGARAFVTNDLRLKKLSDLPILVLDDFVEWAGVENERHR